MRRFVSAGVAVLLLAVAVPADNWPSWRGPTGQGVSREKNLPSHWSKTDNITWKVPLPGAGVSTPVVWGERIFLTASAGRLNDQLHLFCLHRSDGRELWHVRLFGTAPTDLYAPGGMAVPTPVTDGKHVVALFGTGDLVCFDVAGKPRWIRSLAQEYGPFRNRWGMGSSPILVKDLLVIQVDHFGQSYLLGVEAATGKNRWKADRDAHVNWSSPLAVAVKDRVAIVTAGTEKLRGYDAATGQLLWTVPGLSEQCVPSPVRCDDLILAGTEVGSLSIRVDGRHWGELPPPVVWQNKRARAFVPSPLCYQDCYYLAADKGVAICLDVRTGQQLWKERLGGQFHASPVGGDGKVYFANQEGMIYVVAAGKEFDLLARNDLGEMIVASPALSEGQIFFRGEKHLFCIGKHRK